MNKQNMIIVTNDEQVKVVEYIDYKSIQRAVGGLIEVYDDTEFTKANGETITIAFFCNEEGLLIDREDLNKINVGAYILNNKAVIYGNIAILVDDIDNDDSRGFTETETKEYVLMIQNMLNKNTNVSKVLHKQFDDNKPQPQMGFISW